MEPEPIQGLAESLAHLARDLEAESSLEDTLDEIAQAAVRSIPGTQWASISIARDRHKIDTAAATDDRARECDLLQAKVGEGPCMDAAWDDEIVAVPDMEAASDRWPMFATEAVAHGARSMLCYQLFVSGDQLGALNLYSGIPRAFEGEELHQLGRLFAAHAAIAFASARKVEQLSTGLRNRDVIGVAKGILLERHNISEQSAFRLLVRASQTTHRKVHEVAKDIVDGAAADATR